MTTENKNVVLITSNLQLLRSLAIAGALVNVARPVISITPIEYKMEREVPTPYSYKNHGCRNGKRKRNPNRW